MSLSLACPMRCSHHTQSTHLEKALCIQIWWETHLFSSKITHAPDFNSIIISHCLYMFSSSLIAYLTVITCVYSSTITTIYTIWENHTFIKIKIQVASQARSRITFPPLLPPSCAVCSPYYGMVHISASHASA